MHKLSHRTEITVPKQEIVDFILEKHDLEGETEWRTGAKFDGQGNKTEEYLVLTVYYE